jgi:hypothetical protein
VTASFAAPLIDELRTTRTVRVETSRAAGRPTHRTIIWIVVDEEDRVLVRSVRGSRGRWYRDLLAHPTGVLEVGEVRVDVRAEPAGDPDRVGACSRALAAKYPRAGASLASMLVPEVLDATLELHRA